MERGVTWIKSRQQSDGSWDEGYSSGFPMGPTALSVLALIKAGHGDDPAVAKGFKHLRKTGFRKTYGAGLLLMALEAHYGPEAKALETSKRPYGTLVRRGFRKAKGGDKKLLSAGAKWLLRTRNDPLWGYPLTIKEDSKKTKTRDRGSKSRGGGESGPGGRGGPQGGGRGGPGRGGPGGRGGGPPPRGGGRGGPGGQQGGPGGQQGGPGGGRPQTGGGGMPSQNEWDHSNTQYALLGLGAAARTGFKVSNRDLYAVLDQLLAGQDASGENVTPFAVPAADASYAELQTLGKELAELRGEAAKEGGAGSTIARARTFYSSNPPQTMQARGWGYIPSGGPSNDHPASNQSNSTRSNNSMTAAALASVIVLKTLLGKQRKYTKTYAERVDRSIRDGAAYLAHYWTVVDQRHPYYYLYGLERVGIMTGCFEFGGHDWYQEGGARILQLQSRDGSWGNASRVSNGGMAQVNALPQTCFAVLFLARGTPPLIPQLPERPVTGSERRR